MDAPTPPHQSSAYCVVRTTLASEAEAVTLAHGIVEAQLGACVQIESIRSVYVWQERTQDEAEWRLNIKTRSALYPELERWLREHHPYDTPEIICLPITAGSADYLAWVDGQTR